MNPSETADDASKTTGDELAADVVSTWKRKKAPARRQPSEGLRP